MTLAALPPAQRGFAVPEELAAAEPIEREGMARDMVRLMVSDRDSVVHRRFIDLARALRPGDLVVVNNSATRAASVVGKDTVVHFSTEHPGGFVVVEPRDLAGPASVRPDREIHPGPIQLPGDATMELLAPYPVGSASSRLWLAAWEYDLGLTDYLDIWGRPIRYRHVSGDHPLSDYQTIFATVPGSAEMPSAGRPFSGRVLASLAGTGVCVMPVTLHTGVSSLEEGELPYPEWAHVPTATADAINRTRLSGGRVVAVGTTVLRALETAVATAAEVHAFRGWTDLVIRSDHPVTSADGMITGWHEPESTHLWMLEAFAGSDRVQSLYDEAIEDGYRWHEFGDSLLLWSD